MNKYLVSEKFGVAPPKCKVLVNSVTRNGVHLVGSVLDIIGMKTPTYGFIKKKRFSSTLGLLITHWTILWDGQIKKFL